MSAEAVGYVFRHSPFTGAVFAVHFAIADSVNDQHSNEFYMLMENLSTKARCSRQTAQDAAHRLVAEGFLQLIEGGGGRRKASRYRFLFKESEVVYDSRRTVASDDSNSPQPQKTVGSAKETVVSRDTELKEVQPKEPVCSLVALVESETSVVSGLLIGDEKKSPIVCEKPDMFDDFWALYPRHACKPPARKAFAAKVAAGVDPAVLVDAAAMFAAAAREFGTEEQFIPHAATWLRREGYLDRHGGLAPPPERKLTTYERNKAARAEFLRRMDIADPRMGHDRFADERGLPSAGLPG